jgi:hypothetical protein
MFSVLGIAFLLTRITQLILDGEFSVFIILGIAYTIGVMVNRFLSANEGF